MNGTGFVNEWTYVRQWIEQRDSMDGTMRFNEWNKSFQWIDNRPSITGGGTAESGRRDGGMRKTAANERGGFWV